MNDILGREINVNDYVMVMFEWRSRVTISKVQKINKVSLSINDGERIFTTGHNPKVLIIDNGTINDIQNKIDKINHDKFNAVEEKIHEEGLKKDHEAKIKRAKRTKLGKELVKGKAFKRDNTVYLYLGKEEETKKYYYVDLGYINNNRELSTYNLDRMGTWGSFISRKTRLTPDELTDHITTADVLSHCEDQGRNGSYSYDRRRWREIAEKINNVRDRLV